MRKYLLTGGILFVLFVVAFAPAGLLRSALEPLQGVALLSPEGTVWRGAGELYLAELPAGTVRWQFRPLAILRGSLSYHLQLMGPNHDLNAEMALSPSRLRILAAGELTASYLNQWLSPYEVGLTGVIELNQVAVAMPYRAAETAGDPALPGTPAALAPGAASGTTRWSGGNVRYRLSGQTYSGDLPPLRARLGEGLEAYVYPQQGQTPLIRAQLLDNGFVKIGITRLLTRLLNNPWPGSDADHEVVLEVEEQLY